jgi:REP element-mobilizing transposase RayT
MLLTLTQLLFNLFITLYYNIINYRRKKDKIWEKYSNYLQKHFWKEKTFWSDGYFVCSIGEASPETIRNYIANQS